MLDLTKPIQTRSGRKARILCSDVHHVINGVIQPLVVLIEDPNFVGFFSTDGTFDPGLGRPSDLDLVNVPQPKKKVKVEVRLYPRSSLGGVSALAWSEHEGQLDDDDSIATTIIEMEYEERT